MIINQQVQFLPIITFHLSNQPLGVEVIQFNKSTVKTQGVNFFDGYRVTQEDKGRTRRQAYYKANKKVSSNSSKLSSNEFCKREGKEVEATVHSSFDVLLVYISEITSPTLDQTSRDKGRGLNDGTRDLHEAHTGITSLACAPGPQILVDRTERDLARRGLLHSILCDANSRLIQNSDFIET